MTALEDLKREYKKLVGRPAHHTWSAERIQEEIKKKTPAIKEVEAPPINPVTPQAVPTTDPMILQLLAGQQEMMGKIVDSIDQLKKSMPLSAEEATEEFNESLKNTHFEDSYEHEIYALKHKLSDGSEERGLTGKRFNNKQEAEAYWVKEFGAWKFKLSTTKKPRLVENKNAWCADGSCKRK